MSTATQTSRSSLSRLAWRHLLRQLRAGELNVLMLALVIGVGAITAVGLSADRIRAALVSESGALLAADRVLDSIHPVDPDFAQQAKNLGLSTSRTITFPSTLRSDSGHTLAAIKAVEAGYPLRGRLGISDQISSPPRETSAGPKPGHAWADPALLGRLQLDVGGVIHVGKQALTVAAVLRHEPDRSRNFTGLAPRVMIHYQDAEASQLMRPGGRIRYGLLVAGAQQALSDWTIQVSPQLPARVRLKHPSQASPQLDNTLERAEAFLALAALITVILAGVAMAFASRRYVRRQLDTGALLKCFGASQAQVLWLNLSQLAIAALLAAALGCVLGLVGQELLTSILWPALAPAGTAVPPIASFTPLLAGLAAGLVLVLGFALPPLLRLHQVPPLRVLRRQLGPPPLAAWLAVLIALLASWLLLLAYTGHWLLSLAALLGGGAAVLIIAGCGWLLLWGLQKLPLAASSGWMLGLSNLVRQRQETIAQLSAFSLGILVILLLSVTRADLLYSWQQGIPEQAPNQFLINIQGYELEQLEQFFKAQNIDAEPFFPMARGRLLSVNATPVTDITFPTARGERVKRNDYNLSWSQELPAGNEMLSGNWWQEGVDGLSIERDYAKDLGLKLGDVLHFDFGGLEAELTITSIRHIKWDNFTPNFFMLAKPAAMEGFPASYVTSFYLPPGESRSNTVVLDIAKQFPGVSVVDVASVLDQIRAVVARISLAVQYLFSLTLLAGLAILLAAIQNVREQRAQTIAILRTLGASSRIVRLSLLTEFTLLGLVAGLLGGAGADLAGRWLASNVFRFPYDGTWWLIPASALLGALVLTLVGWISCRKLLATPPRQILS